MEHLPVYSVEELARFDAEECKKNIANLEGAKNKYVVHLCLRLCV